MMVDFKCRRCGNCCTINGSVDILDSEVDSIAAFLGLTPHDFTNRYTELKPGRSGLILKDHRDGSCIFLGEDRLCLIDPVKPEQCRGFPHKWRYEEWKKVCSANYPAAGQEEIT